MKKLIVSLAGNPNAGKSQTASHLEKTRGFTVIRPSDLIKQYALLKTGAAPTDRESYAATLTEMFEVLGPYYLANQALNNTSSKICIDGERVPSQIEKIREYGARVIALWAPIEVRHQRALDRGDARDRADFADFTRDEAREYQSSEPPYHSTLAIMQMADYHVDAARPKDEVFASVLEIVDSLK